MHACGAETMRLRPGVKNAHFLHLNTRYSSPGTWFRRKQGRSSGIRRSYVVVLRRWTLKLVNAAQLSAFPEVNATIACGCLMRLIRAKLSLQSRGSDANWMICVTYEFRYEIKWYVHICPPLTSRYPQGFNSKPSFSFAYHSDSHF